MALCATASPQTEFPPAAIHPVIQSALESRLAAVSVIEASLPAHPMAQSVMNEFMVLVADGMDTNPESALQMLAFGMGERPYGVFALDSGSSDPNHLGFCEWLCKEHPDLPVSARALDHLLDVAADRAAACEVWAESAGSSRCGVLARLRRAELDVAERPESAALWLLDAWALDPPTPLYNRVAESMRNLLRQHGQHALLCLLEGDHVPVDTLVRIRKLIESLSAAAPPNTSPGWPLPVQSNVRRASSIPAWVPEDWRSLHAVSKAVGASPESALLLLDSGLIQEASADTALAIFLIAESLLFPGQKAESPETLERIRRAGELRERSLERYTQSAQSLAPDERAHYALLIAESLARQFQAARAVQVLDAASAEAGVSPSYRELLQQKRNEVALPVAEPGAAK